MTDTQQSKALATARLRILRALIAHGYGDGPLVMFDDGLPLCFLRPSPMHLRSNHHNRPCFANP